MAIARYIKAFARAGKGKNTQAKFGIAPNATIKLMKRMPQSFKVLGKYKALYIELQHILGTFLLFKISIMLSFNFCCSILILSSSFAIFTSIAALSALFFSFFLKLTFLSFALISSLKLFSSSARRVSISDFFLASIFLCKRLSSFSIL